MSSSPSWAEHAKLYCPIDTLADSDVEEIFKRLPPYERLIVSEVCRRWHQISRKAWLDIKTLELSPIPGKYSAAVVKQCPNLQFVFAVRKSFDSRELFCLTGAHGLSSVTFYGCEFILSAVESDAIHDVFKTIFSDRLAHTSWTELTLHDASVRLSAGASAKWAFSATFLPTSLKQLQLSGLWCSEEILFSYIGGADGELLEGLDRLQNLESLICHMGHKSGPSSLDGLTCDFISEIFCYHNKEYNFYTKLSTLANLTELCIGQQMHFDDALASCFRRLSTGLPRLEVLFFNTILSEQDSDVVEFLNELITNSGLRILVLARKYFDTDEPIELAARKRFPRGFGSDPLPLLHIFVGKVASKKIRFAKSTSDAAIIHPINQPMPEFLEREDIAPIFEGVWFAEKIKEAAKHGGKLWDYEKCGGHCCIYSNF